MCRLAGLIVFGARFIRPCLPALMTCPSVEGRLIARGDDRTEDNSAMGGGSGAGELRHRYILKPVDVKARLALSVDPSDR